MKRNVCWLSTMRQPARTLFLLLLVGLISFAFISRAAEYLVVNRETDRLAGYYRAIGSLETEYPTAFYVSSDSQDELDDIQLPENPYDVSAGVGLVAQSEYVDFEDYRRLCSGVLQGIYNADVDGFSSDFSYDAHRVDPSGYRHVFTSGIYVSDVLVYGELRSKYFSPYASSRPDEYSLIFHVDQVVTGYPEHVEEGKSIRLRWLVEDPSEVEAIYDSLKVGERYLVRGYYNPIFNDTMNRKVRWENASDLLLLKPLNESGLWFLPVEPGAIADFANPALKGLAEVLRVTEENRHTMLVFSTRDMSAMPEMQQALRQHYLAEGRWLDRLDDLQANRVCVVHRDFAELRGLAVGDSITLKLRDLKAPYYCYIVPGEDWDSWQDYETHTEEFEIVGLYGGITERGELSVQSNYMYVPDSCMPSGFGESEPGVNQFSYSFVLRSTEDVDAFLAETQEALAELDLTVTILDTGWENFLTSAGSIRQSAALNAGFFALVLVLSLSLAAFLYLRQRRREVAILRSLGVPHRVTVRQTLQPIAWVGAVGILIGGLLAWFYALGKAGKTLATLQGPRVAQPAAALSPVWLIGLCAVAFSLVVFFTAMGLLSMARRPVLELLQGTERQVGGKREAAVIAGQFTVGTVSETQATSPEATLALGKTLTPARRPGLAQVARYVCRHVRRAPLKSMLTVAVALCFTFALGWMNWTMERNEAELDRLYRTTQVEGEIVKSNASTYVSNSGGGFIRRRTVDTILKSGFVQNAYLEAAAWAPLVTTTNEGGIPDEARVVKGVTLRGLGQPEQFFATRGGDIEVQYAAGWDESLFAKDWNKEQVQPVVLPVSLLPQLRVRSEDSILISARNGDRSDSFVVAGYYTGKVRAHDGEPILLPISALEQLEGDELFYAIAEFVFNPAKNRELPEFRIQLDTLFTGQVASVIESTFLFWDEELTEVVEPLEKNLSLMTLLYTVTVVVSVLIAAGLATLLLFQSARDAAIMRVLGTTKSRARAMLCGEYLLLCLVGLVVGLSILVALRQDVVAVLQGPALVCAGLYLAGASGGALYSAIAVTNRMPLELLQVKE